MSYTKRQFVEAALEEIGIASYTFDLQPEQTQSAVRRLDAMMATWNAQGIRVGYPIPSSPENSVIGDETNVPDSANEAIIASLAVRLAPSYGKNVSIDTKASAKAGYSALLLQATKPTEKQLPGDMPSGAGNKGWRERGPFLDDPVEYVNGGDSPLEFN